MLKQEIKKALKMSLFIFIVGLSLLLWAKVSFYLATFLMYLLTTNP